MYIYVCIYIVLRLSRSWRADSATAAATWGRGGGRKLGVVRHHHLYLYNIYRWID